ncbi:MAG: 5-(carboxyamino)imidazole ribonucleotide synthase [Cyanobacteriota bacterium]|nr:5-(carboxyamino)imidazole ribonucleotide synthase [Cyanobacteriota bacterium]
MERLGIVGSGQLAAMLVEASHGLELSLELLAADPGDPAVAAAAGAVIGSPADPEALGRLAARCDRIAFENEWVDLPTLRRLEEQGVHFQPGAAVMTRLVDKRRQRQLLEDLQLPCPRWRDLAEVVGDGGDPGPLELPLMAKATCGGYDGRGTERLQHRASLEALLMRVDPRDWILEELVPFERELALTVARDAHGTVTLFPLVETHQHRQICDWVLAPAHVPQAVRARAQAVAASLVTALDYVGVLAIEFFLSPRGLQVNEVAPRTHNSAHYSIEACRTSQFQQQLLLLAGRPAGPTTLLVPGALMVNLVGIDSADQGLDSERARLARLPDAHLHWYGKRGSRPGRKLGHVTLLLGAQDPILRRREAMERLAEVRAIWPLP